MPPGTFIGRWWSRIPILRRNSPARRRDTATRRISRPFSSRGAVSASRNFHKPPHLSGGNRSLKKPHIWSLFHAIAAKREPGIAPAAGRGRRRCSTASLRPARLGLSSCPRWYGSCIMDGKDRGRPARRGVWLMIRRRSPRVPTYPCRFTSRPTSPTFAAISTSTPSVASAHFERTDRAAAAVRPGGRVHRRSTRIAWSAISRDIRSDDADYFFLILPGQGQGV